MLQKIRNQENGLRHRFQPFSVLRSGTFESSIADAYRFDGDEGEPVIPYVVAFNKSPSNKRACLVADEDGFINIIDLSSRNIVFNRSVHQNAIYAACWYNNDTSILTASGDKTCTISDIETQSQIAAFGHTASVKSLSVHRETSSVFASGSRDGNVFIWDTRRLRNIPGASLSPVGALISPHQSKQLTPARRSRGGRHIFHAESPKSVSSVLFLGDTNLLATGGASDGCVKLFDLRKFNSTSPVAECKPPQSTGISSLSLDENGSRSRLLVSCTNSIRAVYADCRAKGFNIAPLIFNKDAVLKSSFYVKSCFSPCGRFILGGTATGSLQLFDCQEPNICQILPGAGHGDINGVAWDSCDPDCIASCSDDGDVRIWKYRRYTHNRIPTLHTLSPQSLANELPASSSISTPTTVRQTTLNQLWRLSPPRQNNKS
uniref:Uncharacterized protein n=1 Tax=Spongospora subterranea TaxID=70186 RepID=A0A0H5R8S9_9EUKA|eukprot:CRZ10525.1 hypothetical protein [Spongospora subterranea]